MNNLTSFFVINAIVVEDLDIARVMWHVMVTEIAGTSLAGEFTRASRHSRCA
jgi:hypothetical protein